MQQRHAVQQGYDNVLCKKGITPQGRPVVSPFLLDEQTLYMLLLDEQAYSINLL